MACLSPWLMYTPTACLPTRTAVLGRGTEAHTLEEAGIADAEGIVAATGDDIDNLSIIMTARHLNPRLFFIARQERRQHNELFKSSGADLVARRSRIVARHILSFVTTPLLQSFLQHLIRSDDDFAERTAARLKDVLDNRAPNIWVFELKGEIAREPALCPGTRPARSRWNTSFATAAAKRMNSCPVSVCHWSAAHREHFYRTAIPNCKYMTACCLQAVSTPAGKCSGP